MPFQIKKDIKKDAHGLLAVSIGQENQTGERFLEEVNALLACNELKTVSILKADSLQRFHYMAKENLSEEDALKKAMEVAQQWEKENKSALDLLKAKGGVIYSFEEQRKLCNADIERIERLYAEDSAFKHSVNGIAGNFAKKVKQQLGESLYNHSNTFKAMKTFILEECGHYLFLSRHEGNFDYIFYPGTMPHPVSYVGKKLIENDLVKHITLHYDEKKSNIDESVSFVEWKQRKKIQQKDHIQNDSIRFRKYKEDNADNMAWIKATLGTCEFVLKMALEKADKDTMESMKSCLLSEFVEVIKRHMENHIEIEDEVNLKMDLIMNQKL